MNQETIESKDFRQFNLLRTNNTGDNCLHEFEYWCLSSGTFKQKKLKFSEAFLKIVDEILVNAIDALFRRNVGGTVSVQFKNTRFCVENTGIGIPIYYENDIWSVQACFSKEFTGSNFESDSSGTTGGLNGVGCKLTNIYSRAFAVETVGYYNKTTELRKYTQKFTDNMGVIHEPQIEPYSGPPYTRIIFDPDYDKVCCIGKMEQSVNWGVENTETINALMIRRIYEAAVYLKRIRANIKYNGETINCDFRKFAYMHGNCVVTSIPTSNFISNTGNEGGIQVAIVFRDPICTYNDKQILKDITPAGHKSIYIINGIVMNEVSNIGVMLIKKITDYFRAQKDLEKFTFRKYESSAFPKKLFHDNIIFMMCGTFEKQHFDLRGQVKSGITFTEKSLAHFQKTLNFDDEFYAAVWDRASTLMQSLSKPQNKTNPKAKVKLYEPSLESPGRGLLVVEGNSAAILIRQIVDKNPKLTKKHYGIYSIQGVPMNAVKNTEFYAKGKKQKQPLIDNDGLQALVNKMNLSYDKKTRKRYDKIIFATDQDHDGVGKICSLLICFFMLYFPDEVKSGLLMRYRTPIIRARYDITRAIYDDKMIFPTKKKNIVKQNFYSQIDFNEFKRANPNLNIEVGYYKGLSTHSNSDVLEMTRSFERDLIQIDYSEYGEKLMHTMYGLDTVDRKLLLMSGHHDAKYRNELKITIDEHFLLEGKSEQIANIRRMLPNVIDGMTPCQNKVLTVARNSRKKYKVSVLGGFVTGKMNYAHGEASLHAVIARMCQVFPGTNRVPLLLSISASAGSQYGGRKVTGSARYMEVKYNPFMDLYYPIHDDDLLKLYEEDGGVYEPTSYVPIVPRILLEDCKSIATGWNGRFVARKFENILRWVRYSIKNGPRCSEMLGAPSIYSGMHVVVYKNKEYIFGTSTYSQNVITITQLPIHVYMEKYIANLSAPKFADVVERVDLHSTEIIHTSIHLKPGAHEIMIAAHTKLFMEAYEQFFGLYTIVNNNLNYYNALTENKNNLVSYECINDIFTEWFEQRKLLYIMRIEKYLVRLRAKIMLHENILRFICEDWESCKHMDDHESDELLSQKKYIRLNETPIKNIQQCGPRELQQLIYENEPSYEYLYNINVRGSKSTQKLRDKLQKLRDQLEKYLKNTWQELWMCELKKLEIEHEKWIKCGWQIED